jgi:hypothetical protein
MAANFVDTLAQDAKLTAAETMILRSVGVRSFQDLHSLVQYFPSIQKAGVRLPLLSNLAAQRAGAAFTSAASRIMVAHRRQILARGATYPPGAHWAPGASVPIPTPGLPGAAPPVIPPPGGAIDLRVAPWPVRNQGARGTCVAFASTACAELRNYLLSPVGPAHLSEQFQYWAIKTTTGDPHPNQDGSFLEFARDALAAQGICEDPLWSYVQTPIPGNVSQAGGGNPSPAAQADAAQRVFVGANYQVFNAPGTGAAAVLNALQQGRPVAITLPVFTDPAVASPQDNWTTPSGWLYGRVLNPPPTSTVSDGHAVCVVGFEPDVAEPKGGFFILRNSWDVAWASGAPSPGNSYSPEQGYGDISATYIDDYLWELLQL